MCLAFGASPSSRTTKKIHFRPAPCRAPHRWRTPKMLVAIQGLITLTSLSFLSIWNYTATLRATIWRFALQSERTSILQGSSEPRPRIFVLSSLPFGQSGFRWAGGIPHFVSRFVFICTYVYMIWTKASGHSRMIGPFLSKQHASPSTFFEKQVQRMYVKYL